MSDSEDPIDLPDDAGDDLFGDGDLDDIPSDNENGNVLSEKDLASDQEGGEQQGYDGGDMDMDQQEVKEKLVLNTQMYRHRTPKSEDGVLRSLRVPGFLKFAAEEYHPDTFQPTEWDMENINSDNQKSVVRYQTDPATGKLKSNAVVYRWSDGSVTLGVGPDHYEIQKKPMVPPADKPYQERQDSHYYGASALLASNLIMVVGHVAEQYTVLPNRNMQDDALAVFASRMAAAARGKARGADNIFTATKDPELQRKEAELAEKERMKAQRRRENAAARLDVRPGYRSGGLSIGDLKGGRRAAGGRKRGQPGSSRNKRRKPEYDSDDSAPAGHRRHDEYEEDGFIVGSDEEGESEVADDDEEDILDDEEEEDEKPRRKRQRTTEVDDEDADADADLDVDEPAEPSRARRRNIVDDEDSE